MAFTRAKAMLSAATAALPLLMSAYPSTCWRIRRMPATNAPNAKLFTKPGSAGSGGIGKKPSLW